MIDHELTDPTGSALTITHNHDGVWITATENHDEVTVGPFPARTLRASFDMGDDLMDGGVTAGLIEREVEARWAADEFADDSTVPPLIAVLDAAPVLGCDGCDECGPAAAIEAEVVSPDQARSLVQERDEALFRADAARELFHGANLEIVAMRKRAEKAEQERDEWKTSAISAMAEVERTEHPRPLAADDITGEMVSRVVSEPSIRDNFGGMSREWAAWILECALTPPPPRPEGAEEIEGALYNALPSARLDQDEITDLADALAGHLAGEGE